MVLNDLQKALAEQMLLALKNKEMNITYKEISQRINPPMHPRNVGHNIGEVSKLCFEMGLPLISAIVISTDSHKPGEGFYDLYKSLYGDNYSLSKTDLYKLERKKIRECKEWYRLAECLRLNIDFPLPNNQKEIRILPMSLTLEFPDESYEEVQQTFFLDRLINEYNGYFWFRESGMRCGPGSLILFQFDNQIIASAVLSGIEQFNNLQEGAYSGTYIFDTHSIRVFEPLSLNDISSICPEIKRFSQTKHRISYDYFPRIQALIEKKMSSIFPEELPLNTINKYPEGSKKQITVNAYERNPKARQECIRHHGSRCIICDFDFGEHYGCEFSGKIHVHHTKPVSEQDGSYEVDPINDLVPVCPNCHFVLHSKGYGVYSIDDIKEKLIKTSEHSEKNK